MSKHLQIKRARAYCLPIDCTRSTKNAQLLRNSHAKTDMLPWTSLYEAILGFFVFACSNSPRKTASRFSRFCNRGGALCTRSHIRRLLFADALFALILALIWVPALPQMAYAYVDPSVMTYTIQALAGVAVALSALAGVVFRRVRRKVFTTFNIDENANKAIEGDIARIDPHNADAEREFELADERAEKLYEESARDAEKRGFESLRWPKRLAFALASCLFAFFIVLIAPALEIFGANADSLVFGLQKVWWVSVLINVAFAIACAFAISAFKGRVFIAIDVFVICLGIAAYVQAFFLNQGMLAADGGYISWSDWYFVQKMIISGIIWLIILILPQVFLRMRPYTWLRATAAVAALIFIMQGVGIASVAIDTNKTSIAEADHPYVTQGGLFTVSSKDNVIMFVLDTYDTALIEELLQGKPDLLANFTDFTYFRNSTGTMIPTMNALPYMLSGIKPKAGQDLEEYRATRYEQGTLLPDIHDAGYSIGLYTDSAMFDYKNPVDMQIAKNTLNIHPMGKAPMNIWDTYLVMDQCALYRQSPWIAKPVFWYYTTDINNRMMGNTEGHEGNDALYVMDDALILKDLKEQGLSPVDRAENGAFRLIHLFGPHFPFNIDEEGNMVGVNMSDQLRQAQGSLKVVETYLADLKEQGLYDNATIIVTADHGIWRDSVDPVVDATSPILLVKPRTESGSEPQPCKTSDMPIDHDDLFPTIMEAIGKDPSTYGSGQTVWQIQDPNRVRYFNVVTVAGDEGSRIVEYQIVGDALNLENWSKTGNVWYDR